ncbi:hypothetical protein NARC_100078 [Candidatus Nitrosocosmicus arcticus]|uniref:Uncharacterized protein n=1 Tax=Candidatus Nitrosocosmicus arcticus TaxID=2035267 RepID=A0A557STT2_9ARCH|nr:hypothetical protein NARC_100078 [Candidatus Nitrosocosmicus arcticus]
MRNIIYLITYISMNLIQVIQKQSSSVGIKFLVAMGFYCTNTKSDPIKAIKLIALYHQLKNRLTISKTS